MRNCVKCDKSIPLLWDDYNNLDGGVGFIGRPGYGSEYDMLDGTITIYLCDDCLTVLQEAGKCEIDDMWEANRAAQRARRNRKQNDD